MKMSIYRENVKAQGYDVEEGGIRDGSTLQRVLQVMLHLQVPGQGSVGLLMQMEIKKIVCKRYIL